jgi:phage terminase large subunit
MGVLKDELVYSNESYSQLKKEIQKLDRIIRNPITKIDTKIRAIQAKYIAERDLEKQHSYLKVVVDNDKADEAVRVKLSGLVSKNFYPLFNNDLKGKPYRLLKGGRSSLKSSAVSIKLVTRFLEDPQANIIAFRKVAKYLSTSVYEQIKWAIYMLKAEDEFTFLKSPLKIVHNATDTAFYFAGVDDPMKIKSFKIAKGYISDLWFEEAAEFESEEEIDTVTDTFVRQDLPEGKEVEIYFTYNPPKNPYVWINEFAEDKIHDTDYWISHSDYTQDSLGVLSEQFIRKIEKIKLTDPDYYEWMYKGAVIGLGDIIYNYKLFNVIDELPNDDKLLFADIAIDTGYSTSATTFEYWGYTLKGNVILLNTYYYSPRGKVNKKAPSDFSKDLWDFVQENIQIYGVNIDSWTVDSADGAIRNQFFKDYGIWLSPAVKKQKVKMIENVESLLVQDRVYVLNIEANKIFLDEHKKYQWDEKTINTPDPKVIKEDDHTCDAFQYYVGNNLSKLGLKI